MMSAALGTSVNRRFGNDHFAAIVAIVRRDSVSPPKLTRYTPIADVFHPVEIRLFKPFGNELAPADRPDGRLGKRLHFDKPLLRHERFNRFAATIASAHVVRIRLDFHHKTERRQIFDDGFSCRKSVHALILACVLVHKSVFADDLDDGQIVTQTEFEVIGIVRGGDLHCASAESDFAIIVRNDGDFPVRERKFDGFAHVLCHLFVFGIDGNGGVAEHGFGTSGCNHDCVVLTYDRVLIIPKIGLLLFVFHFSVAERSVAMRTPVDYAVASVNKSFFVIAYKRIQNRIGAVFVHCES